MNENKVGSPYQYTNSFIEFESKLQPYFDCRSIQGICEALSDKIDDFPVNHYSNACRRINDLEINLPQIDYDKPIFVGNDGSGIKVSNRGEWMRQKWQVKGYHQCCKARWKLSSNQPEEWLLRRLLIPE